MALFEMDSVQPHEGRNRIVRILNYKHNDDGDYAEYTIEVSVGGYRWAVDRRYREFRAFDRARFGYYTSKSFLPPKKLVGNLDPAFLEQRRAELERYLRTALELELWLQKKRNKTSLPKQLARFLHFHKYEVHGIVEYLAERLAERGEWWLHESTSQPKYFELDALELHAVSQRLKLPEPTCDTGNPQTDLGHVLDFCHRVPHLKVRGYKGAYGSSDIPVNALPFTLQPFKQLKTLWITDCNAKMIQWLSSVKKTVKCLVVHYSIERLMDMLADKEPEAVLLAEEPEASTSDDEPSAIRKTSGAYSGMLPWESVEEAYWSFNQLKDIDQSITLLHRVTKLDLSWNCLRDIGRHLQHLPYLTDLNLSNNGLEKLDAWHTRLGNLKRLILAGNSIRSLHGLGKLYSLEFVDVRDNALMHVADVWPMGRLPCLDTLLLQGNPIESSVDYRTRILEAFGDRAHEVILDEDKGSQRELDTVGVRLAIRKAKEEKERLLENTRQQISEKLRFLTEETLGNMSPPQDSNAIKIGHHCLANEESGIVQRDGVDRRPSHSL